jgi:uncharacterized iron-regulated membrane protein
MTAALETNEKARFGLFSLDHRTVWRWHFYAGLFCIPFIVLLAITGSIYLFKPQIEAFIEAPTRNLVLTGVPKPASAIVSAAVAAKPGSQFKAYQLPKSPNDAVQVIVRESDKDWLVYVHPGSAEILKTVAEKDRLMEVTKTIHGELLMGDNGSLLVELAASWAIVMIATGIYLWWPRSAKGLAGVLFPRLNKGSRQFWRDIHAVTGIWISGMALILLLSGLPWTNVWGDSFKWVREVTGTAAIKQDWTQNRSSEGRQSRALSEGAEGMLLGSELSVDDVVALARPLGFDWPVKITPPSKRQSGWMVSAQPQNRTLRQSVTYDAHNGAIIGRESFNERHPIDKVTGLGLSLHEGALFGLANQILGLLTALGLIILSISAFVLWRKRAPDGALGAPPAIPNARVGMGLMVMILAFALFLPVLGISLIAIALVERLILTRWPAARIWLGLTQTSKTLATQS